MQRQRGFAYLWTLMLVAFMGVGLVVASEIYSTTMRREKEKELLFIGRQFRDAIARYQSFRQAGGVPQYPPSLEALLKDPRSAATMRHLRRIYRDPFTGKAEWDLIMQGDRIVGVRSFSQQAPIKQDGFEVTESAFAGKGKVSDWGFTHPPELVLSIGKGVEPGQEEKPKPGGPAQPPGK